MKYSEACMKVAFMHEIILKHAWNMHESSFDAINVHVSGASFQVGMDLCSIAVADNAV